MANSLKPVSVYAIVNDMVKSIMGAESPITVKDTSTFVTVGETLLRSGAENTLNALSLTLAKTIIGVRPYKGRYALITKTGEEYGFFTRKISYYMTEAEASNMWNLDGQTAQLKDGVSIDHYKQKKVYPVQVNFGGLKVIQRHFTRYLDQLQIAFQSEADFAAFYGGIMQELANDNEMIKEAENSLLVINHIAAIYDTGRAEQKINLTTGFNDRFGTTYTTAQILQSHLKEFLPYMVSVIKKTSRLMERNTEIFHLTPSAVDDSGAPLHLLRHTPKASQRLMLYTPLIEEAETMVLPELFNANMLKIDNYEGVDFWQNIAAPAMISCKPNTFNTATGGSVAGNPVEMEYVVGMLFDEEALMVNYKVDKVYTTPINAAGAYFNTFYHMAKDYQADFTQPAVIFYMDDSDL